MGRTGRQIKKAESRACWSVHRQSVYRDLDELRVRIRDLEEQTPHQDRASAPPAPDLRNDDTSQLTSLDVSGALDALRWRVDNLEQSSSLPEMSASRTRGCYCTS